MSRPVSNTLLQKMLTKTGTEPVIILGVSWGVQGSTTTGSNLIGQTGTGPLAATNITLGGATGVDWYSTKQIPGFRNTIIKVGACQNQKRADSCGTVASMSFTLSDYDGYMKRIIDAEEVERKPARAFLVYPDIGTEEAVELLGGHIAGPIQWNETERTVTITLESIQDTVDKELGYSATIEDFSDLSSTAEGIAWPMVFGECLQVPALKAREHTVGSLIGAIRLYVSPSFTYGRVSNDLGDGLIGQILFNKSPNVYTYMSSPPIKNIIYVEGGEKFPKNKKIQISIDGVIFEGKFTSATKFVVSKSNLPRWPIIDVIAGDKNDEDWVNPKVIWIDTSKQNFVIANCHCYFHTSPARQWYNFCIRQEGNKCWFKYPFTNPITGKPTLLGAGYKIDEVYMCNKNGMSIHIAGKLHRMAGVQTDSDTGGGFLSHQMKMIEKSPDNWWNAEPETEVKLWNQGDPDIYIASSIELEEIRAVYGRRRVQIPNGKSKTIIDQIPSTYYTIQLRSKYTIDGNYASAVLFDPPLSEYNQDWEESIWVSCKSTIGNNVSDVLVWIFKNYTKYTPDSSFDQLRGNVASDPVNFALFNQGNPIEIATKIAFQARIGLILDSYAVSARNLAMVPQVAFVFNRSNILKDSLEIGFTDLQDIQTKTVFSWTPSYKEAAPLSKVRQTNITEVENIIRALIPRAGHRKSDTEFELYSNNIAKFGLRVRQESCFIYNNKESVQKSLQFWGLRWSNSWRKVRFRTFAFAAVLQPFDGISIDLPEYFNGFTYPATVDLVSFEPETGLTTVEAWIPVIAGGTTVEPGVWPGPSFNVGPSMGKLY